MMTSYISIRDWDPGVDQQISAQAQAMYETTLARKHGLRREDFRDSSGTRLDVKLREFTGIPFGMVRGVQQRTSYMIPGTAIPTAKAMAASAERLLDPVHTLKTRQNYEETLGTVRKAFYRVTRQPDGFYVWPMPPGVHQPLKFSSEAAAVEHAAELSMHADPRLTQNWWKPVALKNLSGMHGSGKAGGYTTKERELLPDSDFLKPETRGWPVSDKRHAEIALQYMAWGRGNRSEYPKLIKRLFSLYSPTSHPDLLSKAKKYNLPVPPSVSLATQNSNSLRKADNMKFMLNRSTVALANTGMEEAQVTVARFPGKCVKCGGEFVPRETKIVDSGIRGPKGGKKMMHANPAECS